MDVRGSAKFHELKLPQGVVKISDTGGGISLPQFAPGVWLDRVLDFSIPVALAECSIKIE